jgi:hypothetical protein
MSKRSCTEEMFLKDVAEHIKQLAASYLTKKERSATV